MSYPFVRNQIRQWAAADFALGGVQFFDSINRVISPPHDSIWATVEFDPASDSILDFCGAHLSTGVADFIFAGPPNVGDSAVLAAADTCIWYLMQRGNSALTLAYAHQPEEFSNGTADHNYRIYVAVEYRFVFVPPKPTPPLARRDSNAGRN